MLSSDKFTTKTFKTPGQAIRYFYKSAFLCVSVKLGGPLAGGPTDWPAILIRNLDTRHGWKLVSSERDDQSNVRDPLEGVYVRTDLFTGYSEIVSVSVLLSVCPHYKE